MKKVVWLAALTAMVFMPGCAGRVRAEILPPQGEGQIGLQAVVLCEQLALCRAPDTSSGTVQTLRYGGLPIVIEQSKGWAYCALGDSEGSPLGWVNAEYLVLDPAWYRTEVKTPVFAWHDASAPEVALLDRNTLLPVLKDEGDWIVVSLRGATGWIHRGIDASEAPGRFETGAGIGRRDGERFEETILLEGMEETVRYEHVISDVAGIEIDYDYEAFERYTEPDREYFVSRYDDPEDPRNFLEVKYSAENAGAVCASLSEALSNDDDIITEQYELDRAGSCIRFDAFEARGGGGTSALLKTVYIIPASDGCRVAAVQCTPESAEGFGARFGCIMNTLAVVDGR